MSNEQDTKSIIKKKTYKKPTVETEELLAFGAVCDGTYGDSKKSSTNPPDFCASTKINS